jgi:hypothetical protein
MISSLPLTDGANTYGLYFPTTTALLNMTGFPSSTFTGNWTIEFFVYTSSGTAGNLLVTSNSTTLPITSYPSSPSNSKTGIYVGAGISSNAGKIGTKVTTEQSGGMSGAEASYTKSQWTSIVLQYNSATTTQNYSSWVTPYGGTSTSTIYSNGGATNLGGVGYMNTIALGSITSNVAPTGAYITNLRISNIARYTAQSSGSPSPAVVWPGSSYTADSNTVYFNSFNVPSTTTTMGYLLSQIVQAS